MTGQQEPRSLDDFGDLLRQDEAAAVLRVSRQTLYRMRKDGRLPFVKVGGGVRYRKSDLRRLISGDETDD